MCVCVCVCQHVPGLCGAWNGHFKCVCVCVCVCVCLVPLTSPDDVCPFARDGSCA